MGKKKDQSLTERIAAFISRVGEKPEPTFGYIKGELVECRSLAESLEDGAAIREAEAKLEAAQTALEQANTQNAKAIRKAEAALERSNARNAKIEAELQAAESEIERFREEEKKREEEEAELPEVQLRILKRLPSEHGGIAWTLSEISYMAEIPIDEAEIHLNRLENARLIKRTWGNLEHVWYRTIAGSELVLAQRLANEEEGKRPKRYKHADLRKDAHEALLLIARNEEGLKEFDLTARCGSDAYLNLGALHNESFINSDMGRGGLRAGRVLTLAGKGAEYLRERGLL